MNRQHRPTGRCDSNPTRAIRPSSASWPETGRIRRGENPPLARASLARDGFPPMRATRLHQRRRPALRSGTLVETSRRVSESAITSRAKRSAPLPPRAVEVASPRTSRTTGVLFRFGAALVTRNAPWDLISTRKTLLQGIWKGSLARYRSTRLLSFPRAVPADAFARERPASLHRIDGRPKCHAIDESQ